MQRDEPLQQAVMLDYKSKVHGLVWMMGLASEIAARLFGQMMAVTVMQLELAQD
jgi:hypothetical protein